MRIAAPHTFFFRDPEELESFYTSLFSFFLLLFFRSHFRKAHIKVIRSTLASSSSRHKEQV